MVNTFLVQRTRHVWTKSLAVNCLPLSDKTETGGPYTNTQCLRKAKVFLIEEVLVNGIVRTNLKCMSQMTKR